MTIRAGEYEVDRERFLRWAQMSGALTRCIMKDSFDNLTISGEHIISIDDVLAEVYEVPGCLFDNIKSTDSVFHECVKVVYKLPIKKEIN